MNEQARKIIRKHVLQAIKDCAREYYDEPTPEEEADATVDQIAALWPKPLDVEVIEKILFDVRDKTIRHYPVPTSLIRAQAQAIAARFCAPLAEPPDVTMIRQFEYNRGYEDAQNEPTMTISTTSEVAPVERVCKCGNKFGQRMVVCMECGGKIEIEGEGC